LRAAAVTVREQVKASIVDRLEFPDLADGGMAAYRLTQVSSDEIPRRQGAILTRRELASPIRKTPELSLRG
jgi:hypothetical protein